MIHTATERRGCADAESEWQLQLSGAYELREPEEEEEEEEDEEGEEDEEEEEVCLGVPHKRLIHTVPWM